MHAFGLFAERVSEAVEDIHYPAARGLPVDFWEGLWNRWR